MAKIIAVAAPHRTGTNLVAHALGNRERVINLGEIFQVSIGDKEYQTSFMDKWRNPIISDLFGNDQFPYKVLPPIRNYDTILDQHITRRLFREIISGKYDSLFAELCPAKENVSHILVKILFEHCPYYYDTWSDLLLNPNIKIVYLKRLDKVATIVSYLQAYKTKVWLMEKEQDRPEYEPIYIDPRGMLDYLVFLDASYRYFDTLSNHHENIISVVYEELTDNWDDVIHKVQRFVGLPIRQIEPPIRKQILTEHIDLIENIDQLREFFRGSVYEDII